MKTSKLAKVIFAILFLSVSVNSQWYQQNSGVTSSLNSVYFINSSTGFAWFKWKCS